MEAHELAKLNGCTVSVNPDTGTYELTPRPSRVSFHPHCVVVTGDDVPMLHPNQAY